MKDGRELLSYERETATSEDRVTELRYKVGSAVKAGFVYGYVAGAERVGRIDLADGSMWLYEYDARNQVVSAKRVSAQGLVLPGYQAIYAYDDVAT